MSHFPPPWKLCSSEIDRSFGIYAANSLPVCVMATTISALSAKWSNKRLRPAELWASIASPEEMANARVIEAAPALLSALEAIVASLSEQDDEGLIEHAQQMIDARDAIAKARGRQ